MVTAISSLTSRRSLRSASRKRYEIRRTALKFIERAFSFARSTTLFVPFLPLYMNKLILNCAQLKSFLFSNAFLCKCFAILAVVRHWSAPTNDVIVTYGVRHFYIVLCERRTRQTDLYLYVQEFIYVKNSSFHVANVSPLFYR